MSASATKSEVAFHKVIVIGAGASGIAAAVTLARAGIHDVILLEKSQAIGGTWRDNTYPGCACDVPSALYSYSFAPNPNWSRAFAGQSEILQYLNRVAKEHDVAQKMRLGVEVSRARWDARKHHWRIETNAGTFVAEVLISAAGPLHEPKIPELAGLDTFTGKKFHSARWDHDFDFEKKRVAVIGTGASAIQFVPKIQPKVASLSLFQRTAPWVLPKPDHVVPFIESEIFRRAPRVQRGLREAEYRLYEAFAVGFRHPRLLRGASQIARAYLKRAIRDEELREAVTPNFTLGCKRVLLSNEYYPAITKPNVRVHATAVSRVTERGVVDARGREHEVDAIIFGTGFYVTDPPIASRIDGKNGQNLASTWNGSPTAYLGTSVAGFPNLFFLIGPNMGTGHSSAIMIIEAQLAYITAAIVEKEKRGWTSLDVSAGTQASYNDDVQRALATTVYNAGGCTSYYVDKNGRNSTTWPWSTSAMIRRLSHFDANAYDTARIDSPRNLQAIASSP